MFLWPTSAKNIITHKSRPTTIGPQTTFSMVSSKLIVDPYSLENVELAEMRKQMDDR